MREPVHLAVLTYDTVTDAIKRLKPGQNLIYHTGSLMYDRKKGPSAIYVNGAALAARQAYEKGEVTLLQRRLRPLVFQYIALKRAVEKKVANDNRRIKVEAA